MMITPPPIRRGKRLGSSQKRIKTPKKEFDVSSPLLQPPVTPPPPTKVEAKVIKTKNNHNDSDNDNIQIDSVEKVGEEQTDSKNKDGTGEMLANDGCTDEIPCILLMPASVVVENKNQTNSIEADNEKKKIENNDINKLPDSIAAVVDSKKKFLAMCAIKNIPVHPL